MRNRFLAPALLLLAISLTTSVAVATNSRYQALAARIDTILANAAAGKSVIAVKIVSLDTGETVFQRNAHRLMVPASNTKLFTTAAALQTLGPDYTIKTSFYLDGDISKDGVLDGNLIIYGRGDPNISGRFTDRPTAIFEQVADALRSLGLRQINGDIIGDDSYFDARHYGPWPSEDSRKWYAARVSALSFNDNCIDICVAPGDKPGEKPKVRQSPSTSYANIINEASTTSSRNNSVWATPGGGNSDVEIRGKIWAGTKEAILNFPVETPTLYAATVFKDVLQRKGIQVHGRARELEQELGSAVPAGAISAVDWQSLPLSEMIKVVNKRSQNLHAELLFKQVGRHSGRGPTFEGGARAITDFARTAGIPVEDIDLQDGSGLCRSNQVTVDAIVRLLQYMDQSPYSGIYRDSLATAGVDDSVRTLSGAVPTGTVMGKTGSLRGVFAFSGYVDGQTERFAFSIIANNLPNGSYQMKLARDKICKELFNF